MWNSGALFHCVFYDKQPETASRDDEHWETSLCSNQGFQSTAAVHVAAPAEVPPSAAGLAPPSHPAVAAPQSSHLSLSASAAAVANPNHQQELQAKILSLFNSGTGASVGAGGLPSAAAQSQAYTSLGPPPSQNPPRPAMPGAHPAASQGYGAPSGRMPVAPGGQRPPSSASGINFDNPSVQKALDTLIQSGPSLNHLVGSGVPQPPPRPAPGMGQAPAMPMYPRHYWQGVANESVLMWSTSLWCNTQQWFCVYQLCIM